jgi:ribonuclease HI
MILYIDGGCSNSNQKDQAIRKIVWVVTDESGKVLVEKTEMVGSNNIAEFLGLRDAIKLLPKDFVLGQPEINAIYTDSMNNLSWVKGRFGKKLNDKERVVKIFGEILEQNKNFTLAWIPRDKNKAGWVIEEKYNL